jgi:hypothetical protein
MWLCLTDAFFSVVRTRGLPEGHLLVRARRPGEIERYWPTADVERTPGRDYLFRAVVPAEQVAEVMSAIVSDITYPNFKDSVKEPRLHEAYTRVWEAMGRIQDPPPYQHR